jgi:hypothetical protein
MFKSGGREQALVSDIFLTDEKGRRVAVYRDDGWDAVVFVRIGGTMAVYGDAGASQRLRATMLQLEAAIGG